MLKLGKKLSARLCFTQKKIARDVNGEKLKFMGKTLINVFFNGKERKLKVFVIRNSQNLFGTDWIEEFGLFDVSINNFCNKNWFHNKFR